MMRYVRVGLAAIALVLAQGTAALSACSTGEGAPMQGPPDAPWKVAIALDPKGVPPSARFQADISICPANSGVPSHITVDATMPAHKHGMNYKPRVLRAENGRYEVKDLLFHMPGVWRFEVTAYLDGKPHRYVHDVTIE